MLRREKRSAMRPAPPRCLLLFLRDIEYAPMIFFYDAYR